jgi:uncharacterized protein YecE (DUF72 family)
LLQTVRIATAGWANPPAERRRRRAAHSHLEHYASKFNAVEINSTFYRSHQLATYQRWRDATPPGFAFAVKMSRSITHECGLRGCRGELLGFVREVGVLGEKLRVILIQLPPSLEFLPRVASRFFASLKARVHCRLACEPRHGSWFSQEADGLMSEYNVSLVAADPARHPGGLICGGDLRLKYYRLHGSPRMYYSSYSRAFLSDLAKQISDTDSRTEQWCVFDNTALHEAWSNGIQLRRLLSGRRSAPKLQNFTGSTQR